MDGWTDGRTDGRTDGQTDTHTDEQIGVPSRYINRQERRTF